MGASDRQVLFPEPVGARINEPGQHSAASVDVWKRKTSTVELEGPRGPASIGGVWVPCGVKIRGK